MVARLLCLAALSVAVGAQEQTYRKLRMNEIQVLGTHNSYHLAPPPKALEFLVDIDKIANTKLSKGVDQSHSTITEQLEIQNIRQLEIDVFYDPKGGLFTNPVGLRMPDITGLANFIDGSRNLFDNVKETFQDAGEKIKDFAENAVDKIKSFFGGRRSTPMDEPVFKVLHLHDFDFRSSCETFTLCLGEIKAWSDRNRRHVPIVILIEAKDLQLTSELKSKLSPPVYDFLVKTNTLPVADAVPIGKPELYALEAEALSVFPRERIVTPDDVRGNYSTLHEAVTVGGWPYLDDVMGKVLFTLINKRQEYIQDAPNLAGRLFFTGAANIGDPDAAVMIVDNPTLPTGNERVRMGYMVRVRADDVDITEDPDWNAAAFSSGAQMISTDYPLPQGPNQNIAIKPYGVSLAPRCNPLLVQGTCTLFLDGGWANWTQPTCPAACNTQGSILRQRTCTNPPPMNGGKPCEGPTEEIVACSGPPCPPPSDWSSWGMCSTSETIGGCQETRQRDCNGNADCTPTDVRTCTPPKMEAPTVPSKGAVSSPSSSDSAQVSAGHEPKSNNQLGIGLGVGLAVVAVGAVVLGAVLYRRRNTSVTVTKLINPSTCAHIPPSPDSAADIKGTPPPPYMSVVSDTSPTYLQENQCGQKDPGNCSAGSAPAGEIVIEVMAEFLVGSNHQPSSTPIEPPRMPGEHRLA